MNNPKLVHQVVVEGLQPNSPDTLIERTALLVHHSEAYDNTSKFECLIGLFWRAKHARKGDARDAVLRMLGDVQYKVSDQQYDTLEKGFLVVDDRFMEGLLHARHPNADLSLFKFTKK